MEETVLLRNVNLDPLTDEPLCANFLRYVPSRGARVEMPVEYFNVDRCPGIARGGNMRTFVHRIECVASGDVIPDKLRVDMSNVELEGSVLAGDVAMPEGLTPIRPKELVTRVSGKKRGPQEEEDLYDEWEDEFDF